MATNTRLAFEIEMTTEQLQEMCKYVSNAQQVMTEGQVFRLEVSHNVDFVFKNLKPFKGPLTNYRETEVPLDSGRISTSPLE